MLISNSGRSEIFSEGVFISACTPLLSTTFATEQNAYKSCYLGVFTAHSLLLQRNHSCFSEKFWYKLANFQKWYANAPQNLCWSDTFSV